VISFEENLAIHGLQMKRGVLGTLQVNIGRLCNLACHHCHVEAGPKRTENMEGPVVDRVIELLEQSKTIHTVDITGGAPELNPHFRRLVSAARELGKTVIDRCNLTVFYEPGQEETAYFLKEHQVQVVASLPCYSKGNVEKQRGRGVFDKSIEALRLLNKIGYAQKDTKLTLDLVYNPLGPFLPPDQKKLEPAYRVELKELFGIEFNRLYTITNMPIRRFLSDLERVWKTDSIHGTIVEQFQPSSCRGSDVPKSSVCELEW
jgi:radical SAM/Cys-rich protein